MATVVAQTHLNVMLICTLPVLLWLGASAPDWPILHKRTCVCVCVCVRACLRMRVRIIS